MRLTKVRLSLMDGPPNLMAVHIKDHGGLEIPFDVLKPTKLKQLLEEGASIETTPTDQDRPFKPIGAAAVTNEFKPPLNLPPMSSVGARVVFELPDVLPEYAFDSLRRRILLDKG